MTEPLITKEQACRNARAALDRARERRDRDYAAGRLSPEVAARYEELVAEVRRNATRNAARIWRNGLDAMDRMSVEEAARACWSPGGPSLADLVSRITRDRELRRVDVSKP